MSRLELFMTSLLLCLSGGLVGALIIPWLGLDGTAGYSLLLLVCLLVYLGGFAGMFWACCGPMPEPD